MEIDAKIKEKFSFLTEEEIKNPFIFLDQFYNDNNLAYYRKMIWTMLHAAYSRKYWKMEEPGSLLYFVENLNRLVEATFLIHSLHEIQITQLKKDAALDTSSKKALDYCLYVRDNFWTNFPRSLNKKEFKNPNIVFRKFFNYSSLSQWKIDLKYILRYSLLRDSTTIAGIDFDYLSINKLLQKLVEASYLLEKCH